MFDFPFLYWMLFLIQASSLSELGTGVKSPAGLEPEVLVCKLNLLTATYKSKFTMFLALMIYLFTFQMHCINSVVLCNYQNESNTSSVQTFKNDIQH